jgi:hypothetical protein
MILVHMMTDKKLMTTVNVGSDVVLFRLGQRTNILVILMSGMSSR